MDLLVLFLVVAVVCLIQTFLLFASILAKTKSLHQDFQCRLRSLRCGKCAFSNSEITSNPAGAYSMGSFGDYSQYRLKPANRRLQEKKSVKEGTLTTETLPAVMISVAGLIFLYFLGQIVSKRCRQKRQSINSQNENDDSRSADQVTHKGKAKSETTMPSIVSRSHGSNDSRQVIHRPRSILDSQTSDSAPKLCNVPLILPALSHNQDQEEGIIECSISRSSTLTNSVADGVMSFVDVTTELFGNGEKARIGIGQMWGTDIVTDLSDQHRLPQSGLIPLAVSALCEAGDPPTQALREKAENAAANGGNEQLVVEEKDEPDEQDDDREASSDLRGACESVEGISGKVDVPEDDSKRDGVCEKRVVPGAGIIYVQGLESMRCKASIAESESESGAEYATHAEGSNHYEVSIRANNDAVSHGVDVAENKPEDILHQGGDRCTEKSFQPPEAGSCLKIDTVGRDISIVGKFLFGDEEEIVFSTEGLEEEEVSTDHESEEETKCQEDEILLFVASTSEEHLHEPKLPDDMIQPPR